MIKMVPYPDSLFVCLRQEIDAAGFQGLFYSQGSPRSKCLSVLVNDTSRQTISLWEWSTNVKQINQRPPAILALFVLKDGSLIAWTYLHSVKLKNLSGLRS